MVIVEGSDNSGKTTLARSLAEDLSMPYQHSRGPWQTRRDLLESIEDIHTTNEANDYFVQDRYGLISEMIYQPILRPDNPMVDPSYLPEKALWQYVAKNEFVVICLPPREEVLSRGTVDEQPLVVQQNLSLIWSGYQLLVNTLKTQDIRLFVYDWTIPWHYRMLKLAIQGYYDNDVAHLGYDKDE